MRSFHWTSFTTVLVSYLSFFQVSLLIQSCILAYLAECHDICSMLIERASLNRICSDGIFVEPTVTRALDPKRRFSRVSI